MAPTSFPLVQETPTARRLLTDLRAARAEADAAEVRILLGAAAYADLHPAFDGTPETLVDAGPGRNEAEAVWASVPAVDAAAPAEFGLALGVSHDAASRLIHDALQLRHRLPRTWAAVCDGQVQAWRARRIAQAMAQQPDDVVSAVDGQICAIAQRVGLTTLERLLTAALWRLHPEDAEAHEEEQLDRRHATLRRDITAGGIGHLEIAADLVDLLGFDDALAVVAEVLAEQGCREPLDVRRSMAVGVLADPVAAAELLAGRPRPRRRPWADDEETSPESTEPSPATAGPTNGPTSGPTGRRPSPVVYFHVPAEVLHDGDVVARAEVPGEGSGVPVLETDVRRWLGRAEAQIVVRPVIDLAGHVRTDAYEIPDRLREQVVLRDGHCAFPWCSRTARACDLDHVVPFARGGSTCSCNLAPLCRRHHRLKTHRGWTYTAIEPGTWVWVSPQDFSYLVDPAGTRDVTPPGHPPGSGCHHPDG